MLFGIAIEVFPQHWRQNEFRIDGGLQQIGHCRTARRIQRGQIAQRKIAFQIEIAAESHQHDALAVLWQEVFAVDNFRIVRPHVLCIRHVVTQFIQRLHDNAEGFAAVMAL